MARLATGQEGRGLEEGIPARAVLGSLGIHTALLLFMVWGARQIDMPTPPVVYRVELVAAARAAPVRTVPVPERARAAPRTESPERPLDTKPRREIVPRRETRPAQARKEEVAEPAASKVEERPAAPPKQAEEGVDIPVRLEGAPFPYPDYLANIILQIKRHWRPPTGATRLRAELAFTILRDGTVEEVAWVQRSGNPAFDLEARGAIEAAGRRQAFGPLPGGYPADRLRVSFFFDPTRY